ncbi:MAG: LytR/AlgR family response regulator transcription factor [Marinicellaceae bacterium]
MDNIKALIVDDEALARVNIREALEPYENWQIVGELNSGKELLSVCDKTRPDVVFLDIQMPGVDGINLAKKLIESQFDPYVIFVTAYDEYAVNAFELCAFDYLLKPFDDERLLKTIQRFESYLNQNNGLKPLQKWQKNQLNSNKNLDKLIIRSIGSIRIIAIDNVSCFYASGNYVEVYHNEGMHLHRVSLSFLETRLNPEEFVRVHRSAIVKLTEIKELNTLDDNTCELLISNGECVKVSSSYKIKLFKTLGIN